ncbi:hypothetical protein V6N12_073723 [Hibiscus sabdariffa]|uniref:Uncharacterized protein n=2 Tax=Hibiscus sabdariffa TaxID=183260 RepID=A0ABR2CT96_9ROSI
MVERDHKGEDVAVKNGDVMEDESMGINGSLHVQPSQEIKSELKGEGVRGNVYENKQTNYWSSDPYYQC